MKLLSTFFILLFLLNLAAVAQTFNVLAGAVKTQMGSPIPAATISVLNTTKATASDQEGRFNIVLTEGNYQLSISAVGYATQFKTVNLRNGATINLTVQLQAIDRQLNEVLVSAEKKQQDVQKIPAAVTVLDAKQIRDYRLWDITNLTAIAPNLFTVEHGNSTSSNFLNIRGVMGFPMSRPWPLM